MGPSAATECKTSAVHGAYRFSMKMSELCWAGAQKLRGPGQRAQ